MISPQYIISIYCGPDLLDIRTGDGQHVMDTTVKRYPMANRMEMITLMGNHRFYNEWTLRDGQWVSVKYMSFPE